MMVTNHALALTRVVKTRLSSQSPIERAGNWHRLHEQDHNLTFKGAAL